ncbi:MAG: lipopolysaccharide biosynthesis protein [Bacteroidetes bacterium]|jgi:uncharacterized protein involved in exopolysaccharide biosynthesis|nr:lipopolysaccharide biosynthesis protein [Bacteroidota bacterium]
MESQDTTNGQNEARGPGAGLSDDERAARSDEAFWSTLGTLWRYRRVVVGVTGVAAVLSVVISLLLPNWYMASARLLLPAQSGPGILAGALSELPSAAQSLLGDATGDYARYLAILTSRGVAERAVEEFDLTTVYETSESETPVSDAVEALRGNTDFVIDEEYDFLTVEVLDKDPERAAELANFYVKELTRRNAALSSQSAANFRTFIEERYEETEAKLDSVLNRLRDLQQEYGVMDLTTQGEVFYESLAELRLQIIQAEADYERLRSAYGSENSLVRQAQQSLASARRAYQQALSGGERLMPVAQDSLPKVTRQFYELEQERLILSELIKYTRPVLEEARFDEQRQVEAVQVVDAAVPPEKKAKPKRSIICITMTISAFLLSVLFVLVYDWWRRRHGYFAQRLRASAAVPSGEVRTPESVADRS